MGATVTAVALLAKAVCPAGVAYGASSCAKVPVVGPECAHFWCPQDGSCVVSGFDTHIPQVAIGGIFSGVKNSAAATAYGLRKGFIEGPYIQEDDASFNRLDNCTQEYAFAATSCP